MRRLFVILAAHLQNQDVENDLLLRQQYKKLTAFNISADVFVIGNEPPGRDNEKLMNMVRRDGLNYHNAPAANARVTRRMQPTFRIEKPPFCVGAQATP